MEYKIKYGPEGDKRLVEWNYRGLTDEVMAFDFDKSVIFDLGANIFDHSVYYAIKYPESTVYAFEPITEYFDMGIKNIEDHNVTNVIPVMKGVGDVSTTLQIAKMNQGSSINRDDIIGAEMEEIVITTVDDFVKEDGTLIPTFIKLDVEGFEENTIKGMKETLKNHKPALWIEYHPHLMGIDMQGMIDSIKDILDLGYGFLHLKKSPTEILFVYGKGSKAIGDITQCMYENRIRKIRKIYDQTDSKIELAKLETEYKEYAKYVSFTKKLFWSKLYRIFTFIKAR